MGTDKLSNAEQEIMEVIWGCGEAMTAREVFEKLADKDWKYTTVATFLTRLVKKGVLVCRKRGIQNCYEEKIGRNRYLAEQADEFVRDMYDGSAKNLIACLCKERISENDYRELMEMLDKYEQGGK